MNRQATMELAWTNKSFDYFLYASDGYLFVRDWKKRWAPKRDRPPILPAAESRDGGGGEENAASRVEGRCKFCGDCRLLDVNGHCLVCVNGMERTKGD